MKSNPPLPNLAKQDFIAQRFHPQSGFIPTQADLTEKDSELYPILSLFLLEPRGVEPLSENLSEKLSPYTAYLYLSPLRDPDKRGCSLGSHLIHG